MRARIYQPARNAMQSGTAKTKGWVLDFPAADARDIDPLMGWTSSDDTQSQVRLRFGSLDEALAYAKENSIEAEVLTSHKRAANIRPRGYGENFATDRRAPWTH
ncbi:MAG: ETC complex I subunit [Paracoccus sp. (in: a-proteobacteria)]|uniref:ETC complex I subunit n=1 Tax=Paracoccus sp. TaxID=267 RepID=UPI0026E066B7|nr:ETC complex I subunit [Paracoccus sp. (in: a-proteobacteria)]MDO5621960.1 ETC complex I subunit [Paracoccus sp. (in: a-proteobacteria)]